MKLKYERGKESYVKMVLHYTGVVMVVAAIAFISSRPGWMSYYDATQTNHKTLSLGSKAVMDSIGLQRMTITTYVNLLESNYHFADKKKQLEDMKRFEQYSRFNPNIDMKYVYYWADTDNSEWDTHYPDLTPAQRASHLANAWRLKFDDFLTPEQLAKQIDLAPEEFRMVRVIEDDSRSGRRSHTHYYPVVRFTDTAGNEQLVEMTTDTGAGLKPGDSVSIVYTPGNPKKMDLEQALHTSGTLVLAIVGGICTLVGLGIIGVNIHQSRKA